MKTNNQTPDLEDIYRSDGKFKFHKKKTAFMITTASVYIAIFIQGLVVLCSDENLNQLTDLSTKNSIDKFCIVQIIVSVCMPILQFVLIKISSRPAKSAESFGYCRGIIQLSYTIIILESAIFPYLQTQNNYLVKLSFTIFFELMFLNTVFVFFEPNAFSKYTVMIIANVVIIVRITYIQVVCLVPCLLIVTISVAFFVIDGRANREVLRRIYLKNQKAEVYRTFLDLLPEGVAILVENGSLKYVNNSMKRIFGCSEENIVECILGLANSDAKKSKKSKKETEKTRLKSNHSLDVIPDDVQASNNVGRSFVLRKAFQPEELKKSSSQMEYERLDEINRNILNSSRSDAQYGDGGLKLPIKNAVDVFRNVQSEQFKVKDIEGIGINDRVKSGDNQIRLNSQHFNISDQERTNNKDSLTKTAVNYEPINQPILLGVPSTNAFVNKKALNSDKLTGHESLPLNVQAPSLIVLDGLQPRDNLIANSIAPSSMTQKNFPSYIEVAPSKSIELFNESLRKNELDNQKSAKHTKKTPGNFRPKYVSKETRDIESAMTSFPENKLKKLELSTGVFSNKTTTSKGSGVNETLKDTFRKSKSLSIRFGRWQTGNKTRLLKTYNTIHPDIRTTFESLMNRLKEEKRIDLLQSPKEDVKTESAFSRFFNRLMHRRQESQPATSSSKQQSEERKRDETKLRLDGEDCCILMNSKLKMPDHRERLLEVKLSPTFRDNKPCALILIKDTTERDLINRLQETDNYKNTLMASVSHELRTPLNCIILMLEMLREYLGEDLINNYLNPAINSSKLQLSLVNDILDFAQIRAGKLRFTYEAFNLHDLLKETLSLFEIQANNRNVQLRFEYDARIPRIFNSDRNRVSQIVLNLLGNAIRHTNQGFILLRVVYIGPDRVSIMVRDTSQGIKKENFKRLFSAFSKADFSIGPDGFGLGLSISQTIARRLGPKDRRGIKVQSEFGRGSCFFFMLESVPNDKLTKPIEEEAGLFGGKDEGEEAKLAQESSDDDDSENNDIEAEDKLEDEELLSPANKIRNLNKSVQDNSPKRPQQNLLKFPDQHLSINEIEGADNDKELPNSDSVATIVLDANLNNMPLNSGEGAKHLRPSFPINLRKAFTHSEDFTNRVIEHRKISSHPNQDRSQSKNAFLSIQTVETTQKKPSSTSAEQEGQNLGESSKPLAKKKQSTFEELKLKELSSTHMEEKQKLPVKKNLNVDSIEFLNVAKSSSANLTNASPRPKPNFSVGSYDKNCKCEDVLLVDDNDFNLLALRKLLNVMEIKTVQAHNGQIAINTVLDKKKSDCCKAFRIVFMDCDMPVKNGFEATKELKEMQRKGEIPPFPIIATTAYVGKTEVDLCFESGMDEYLNKPVLKNKLEEVLKKWYKSRLSTKGMHSVV